MENWKPPESSSPATTEAQQQPPCSGSTKSQDTSASSHAPLACRKVSSSSRTSMSSRSSTSSGSTKCSQKSTSRKTYKKAAGEEEACDEGQCQHYRSAASWCMVLMAKTYPPRHVVCRKDVPKADKASQTPCSFKMLQKEWQPSGKKKKKKRKKKNNSTSNGQDQPQQRTSRASSAMESCSQALPHRAPSPPEVAVTLQKRTSLFSLCMAMYDEEGEEQDEAGLEPEGKQVNVGEMEFHLPPEEIHLPEQNYQEVLEDLAVDEDVVDIPDPDFNVGTMEVPLPSEELQEAPGHTREDTASVDSLCSYLATLETCLIPELQDDLAMDGYKEDTQDLDSIPGSVVREVNFASKENLEALRDMEEDKISVSSEGSTLATPRIHSNLEEVKEAKVNERIAPSPGCASKTSVTSKPLPKQVIKPVPKETTRDPAHILLPGIECKAAKSLTRKQGKAHGTSDTCNCDSIHARGILFFKLFLKLVELAALPQRILFQIISYYQQQLSDCPGQGVWVDGDFLECHKKKPHKTQKETVYSLPSFISVPALHVSATNKRKAVGYVEHLGGSPYAQVPIFPLVYKQDTATLTKTKKGSQKVARQRNEPTASFRSHISHEESQGQEEGALEPPVHHTKQSCSPADTTERPDTPHSPATASNALPGSLGRTQAQKAQAANNAYSLSQRLSLLELWQKIIKAQMGLQMDDERFHQTFCTYSWSWNACRELVTRADLRRLERQLRRQRQRQMAEGPRQKPCRDDSGGQ
ncbi:PREDICTED: EF-hand calcium-binding domain-containing protein 3 [Calidris pugnax]|uniref:EF-hand calcium-binding domain-containing protein 3 n=1 Tax=Calidris pugnax TaxID=198806 RepID=UPI00071D6BDA|nr:PREDICTED: EF-hand calcium-binding domain-containing protein 3 [Calidris pugnax]